MSHVIASYKSFLIWFFILKKKVYANITNKQKQKSGDIYLNYNYK